jgi:hypothetical protein
MRIPSWFVIGCGLLVLNLILVIGGTLSRHASAEPPDEAQAQSREEPRAELEESRLDPAANLPDLTSEPVELPAVPSLENNSSSVPNVVSLDEIKNAVGEMPPAADLLAPLDAMIKGSFLPVSEQLSHSYFESMKLRLKTVEHLNQSTIGLVDEAAILYQRGEIAEAQKLLGIATQLRETTARLLVTHQ